MNDLAADPSWSHVAFRNVNPGANKTTMTGGDGVPGILKLVGGLFFKPPTKGGNILYDAAFNNYSRNPLLLDEGKERQVVGSLTDSQRATLEALLPA